MAGAPGWTYATVSMTFWNDVGVRGWSDDGRMLALYLLTNPYRSNEGFYSLPRGLAADDLGWSPTRFAVALTELQDADFVEVDDAARLVLIVKALKYTYPLRGRPSIKGALNVLDQTKGSPRLFARFLKLADTYQATFAAAIREHYGLPEGAYEGASDGVESS